MAYQMVGLWLIGGNVELLPRATCTHQECDSTPVCKGVCQKHYDQKRNNTSTRTSGANEKALTESDVAKIKKMHSAFKTNFEIAKEFGIGQTLVRRVLHNKYTPRPDGDSNVR